MPEVIEFDEFEDAHGASGGWHPDDHAEFLRILTSCRGDYSHAVLVATDQLPGLSRDQIIGHSRQSPRSPSPSADEDVHGNGHQ